MPRSDLSTAAVCSPSTATMVMARTRCGSASGLSRTVKPPITPSAVKRSMRFCTVPRETLRSWARVATGNRAFSRRSATRRRSVSSIAYSTICQITLTIRRIYGAFCQRCLLFISSLLADCQHCLAPEIFGGEATVPSKPLLLLTDPTHFEVSYTINPWMRPYAWAENPVGHLAAARHSFQSLAVALTAAGARLEIMPGVAGLPDMVFPANAAIVLDRRALLSRFSHPERQ